MKTVNIEVDGKKFTLSQRAIEIFEDCIECGLIAYEEDYDESTKEACELLDTINELIRS